VSWLVQRFRFTQRRQTPRAVALQAAKAKFPGAGHYKVRHEYRVACRAHWRAYKTAQRAAKKAA